ncbi:helix-turn-helix transcriptional regulator [Nocardioides sp.]|uniref:ArsR/SmtB family transcription factor n=1 Tax=Nocardioides sp. TaxID=35761 RepID=UPI0027333729|nr:metalloregulator ArsR/SmtB family transcription factor [Nocardioides sp.]MDP3894378.1 metalloregulator ArsR/SmtB family transcription factor [Nocardioides sp.]
MSDGPNILARYSNVSDLFGALSSPVRSAIVHRLTDGEQSVSNLVDALGLSQPLVSQHLRVLRSVRLVRSERRGRETAYSLADEHVAHVFLDAFHHTQENHDDHH